MKLIDLQRENFTAMNEDYPFTTIIKARLKDLGKDVTWLCGQIEKSESWFWKIKSIKGLQVGDVESIIEALDFDLFIDWYTWKKSHGGKGHLMLAEPEVPYKKQKNISLQFTITGDEDDLSDNIGKVIKSIRKEGEKHGFDIK